MVFRSVVRDKDIGLVRGLAERAGVFSPEEVDVAAELVEEALIKGEKKSGYSFVFAEESGCVSGYSCFGRIPMTQASYDLYWIVVEPSAQGKGLARALLAATEKAVHDEAGGEAKLYAETSSTSLYAPARAFYASAGFVLAARFQDFYKRGDDKIIFAKNART